MTDERIDEVDQAVGQSRPVHEYGGHYEERDGDEQELFHPGVETGGDDAQEIPASHFPKTDYGHNSQHIPQRYADNEDNNNKQQDDGDHDLSLLIPSRVALRLRAYYYQGLFEDLGGHVDELDHRGDGYGDQRPGPWDLQGGQD